LGAAGPWRTRLRRKAPGACETTRLRFLLTSPTDFSRTCDGSSRGVHTPVDRLCRNAGPTVGSLGRRLWREQRIAANCRPGLRERSSEGVHTRFFALSTCQRRELVVHTQNLTSNLTPELRLARNGGPSVSRSGIQCTLRVRPCDRTLRRKFGARRDIPAATTYGPWNDARHQQRATLRQ
jgi:hypothetical protein